MVKKGLFLKGVSPGYRPSSSDARKIPSAARERLPERILGPQKHTPSSLEIYHLTKKLTCRYGGQRNSDQVRHLVIPCANVNGYVHFDGPDLIDSLSIDRTA